MSKTISYVIAAIFLLFAAVQYNDPDWYLWIPVYLIIAILVFISIGRKLPLLLLYAVLFLFLVWFLSMMPNFIQWIKADMPDIAGIMKASNPEIELMREFFGVLICIITLVWLVIKNRK